MRLTSSGLGGQSFTPLRALDRIVNVMERHKRLPERAGGGSRRRDPAISEGRRALPGLTMAWSLLRGDGGRDK